MYCYENDEIIAFIRYFSLFLAQVFLLELSALLHNAKSELKMQCDQECKIFFAFTYSEKHNK